MLIPDREEGIPDERYLRLEMSDDGGDVGGLVADRGKARPGHARHGVELGHHRGLKIRHQTMHASRPTVGESAHLLAETHFFGQ